MPTLRAIALLAVTVAVTALPSSALAARTIRLKVPSFPVPARSDREVCTFVAVPMDEPFNFQKSLVVNIGGDKHFTTHHFLAWVYNGNNIDGFKQYGRKPVDGKACLDFGPSDTNTRTLIAGAQTVRLETSFGDGLAQQLSPTTGSDGKKVLGIILNSHWINSSNKTKRASVKLKLVAAKPHTVRRFVLPIFEVTANASIGVPPGQMHPEHGYWGPGSADFGHGALGGGSVPKADQTACVVGVTSHMHKRGREFTIDLVKGPVNILGLGAPTETVLSQQPILQTREYTDPPQVSGTEAAASAGRATDGVGMPVRPGEYLRYTCMHDNTGLAGVPMKMGCEEQAGVTPGKSILQLVFEGHFDFNGSSTGAARRCDSDANCTPTDPAFPGRTFTGRCVPANLVFGFTSDDDMCIMPGGYYDADANGSCNVANFPVEPNG